MPAKRAAIQRTGSLSRAIAVRWFFPLEMPNEKILHSPLAICSAHSVTGSGDHHKLEVFPSLDERIAESIRRFGRHVVVHFPNNEEQLPSQSIGIVDVRACRVLWTNGVTHPLLVP